MFRSQLAGKMQTKEKPATLDRNLLKKFTYIFDFKTKKAYNINKNKDNTCI